MDKEELLRMVTEVATKAARDAENQDTLFIIAKIKASVLDQVSDLLSKLILADSLTGGGSIPTIKGTTGQVAYQIAECAEIIMRREWIEREIERK